MHPAIYELKKVICEVDALHRIEQFMEWEKRWTTEVAMNYTLSTAELLHARAPEAFVEAVKSAMAREVAGVLIKPNPFAAWSDLSDSPDTRRLRLQFKAFTLNPQEVLTPAPDIK